MNTTVSDIAELTAVDRRQKIDSLYREQHRWLKGWISQRLGCAEQASDLAQDAFIKVMKQRRMPVLDQPRAYLSSVARNLMIDLFRRRSVEQAYLEALGQQPEGVAISPEDRHCIIETLLQIDRMLDKMGERPRQIFLLAQLDGLSYVAISRQLDISVNTVRKHFIRAMVQCLALVDED